MLPPQRGIGMKAWPTGPRSSVRLSDALEGFHTAITDRVPRVSRAACGGCAAKRVSSRGQTTTRVIGGGCIGLAAQVVDQALSAFSSFGLSQGTVPEILRLTQDVFCPAATPPTNRAMRNVDITLSHIEPPPANDSAPGERA